MKKLFIPALVIILLVSCSAGTKIVKSWTDPNAMVRNDSTNKTLLVAMVKDESSRRLIEDALLKRLNGHGVASYTFIYPEVLERQVNNTCHKN
jgi:hypothetical protein